MQGWTPREARLELERRARQELERRRTKDPEAYKAGVVEALRSELFAQQLAVMDDPSRRISLCCSRRAGKSELAARMIACALLEGRRNDYVLFAARTLQRAKQIILDVLKRINEQYALGWWFKDHTGEVTTPDGGVLMLLGVDDQVAMEKVRGSRYRLAICDEASTYEGYLQYLIRDCISPGTKDYSPRGRIVVCGTPGPVRKGWWFDVATGLKKGYSCHYWTLLDNPHIPDAAGALREVREDEGLSESDPVYIREYLGQWAASESELVYAYDGNRNDVRELPVPPPDMTMDEWVRQDWLTTVGADIGYNDDFAITVLGSPPHSKDIFVLHVHKEAGLLAGQQADRIKEVRDRYRPSRTVIDAGAMGKLPFEEFNARYGKQAGGVAVRAEKRNKVEAIGLMNSDLRSGAIKVWMPAGAALAEEWRTLPWEDPIERTKEHSGFANHLCDSALYAWRSHKAFMTRPKPHQKTPEELEKQRDHERNARVMAALKQRR